MTAAVLPENPRAVSVLDPPAVRAPEAELPEVRRVASFIEAKSSSRPALVGPGDERIELPESVYRVLREAVDLLCRGQSVSIMATNQELTSQQAADLLNVSRPYLIRLLNQGEIPFHRTGTHRRILPSDLEAYRSRRDQQRRRGLKQMVREAEELGLYDIPEVPVDSLVEES